VTLAVETLQALRETPGVAGAYLLTSNREEVVEELLTRAGMRAAPSKQGFGGLLQPGGAFEGSL
jgi:hypothetical protein